MKDKLHELKRLADDIAAEMQWREPHQRKSFNDCIEWALKAAHKALNEPCIERTKEKRGDTVVEREVERIPYCLDDWGKA